MKKLQKRLAAFLLLAVLLVFTTVSIAAHSGRTDKNGGHKDNKNASGLGSYHYHCGGNPPHLHEGGICSYGSSSSESSTSNSSTSNSDTSKRNSSGGSAAASAPTSTPVERKDEIIVNGAPEAIQVGEECIIDVQINAGAGGDYTLTSSNEAVISVADNKLTAVGAGTAEIMITTSNNTKAFALTVQAVPVAFVKVKQEMLTLEIGETTWLNPVIQPSNATNKEVAYQSSDTKVVTVSAEGHLKGQGVGRATVVITAADGISKIITVDVTEVEITSIRIDDSRMNYLESGEIDLDEKWDLRVITKPREASTDEIAWESSDESIVVIKDNIPTPIGTGEVVLTVTAPNGIEDKIVINIIDTSKSAGGFVSVIAGFGLVIVGSIFFRKGYKK